MRPAAAGPTACWPRSYALSIQRGAVPPRNGRLPRSPLRGVKAEDLLHGTALGVAKVNDTPRNMRPEEGWAPEMLPSQ